MTSLIVGGVALALIPIASVASADVVVHDGDDIIIDGRGFRLERVDAFELGQKCSNSQGSLYDCGARAKAALKSILRRPNVKCVARGKKSGKVLIANCLAGGQNVEEVLIRSGWALVRPDLISNKKDLRRLCAIEAEAAAQKRGAWSGKFDLPYYFRGGSKETRAHVSCAPTAQPTSVKPYVFVPAPLKTPYEEAKEREAKAKLALGATNPPAGETQPPIKPYVFVPAPLKTPYEEAKEREAKAKLALGATNPPAGETQPPIKPYVFVPAPLKTPYEEAKETEAKAKLARGATGPPAGETQPPIKPYVFVPAPLKTPYEEAKEREARDILCRYVRAVPIGLLRTYCL